MKHNALISNERPADIFQKDHALHTLKLPTFDTIRRSLGNHFVNCIWFDSAFDESRKGFRVSYDELYGEGSSNVMPFIATWLSSGGGSQPEGNIVILPEEIDPTIVEYMKDHQLLGAVQYLSSIEQIKQLVRSTDRKLYCIDDLGTDFDEHSVIGSDLSTLLNSKEYLSDVSSYAPREISKNMFEVTTNDFITLQQDSPRIYLKTCNTEAGGAGVFVCNDKSEFERNLQEIRKKQKEYNLNTLVILQPELKGENKSFQIFLDPQNKKQIQIVALTNQLVEDDGKTYKASENLPINQAYLTKVGPVIIDMAEKVWQKHHDAFGFLMCDYFEDGNKITIYDPGIRPTGNTATAMAMHFTRKLSGQFLFVCNFHLRINKKGFDFKQFRQDFKELTNPEHIIKHQTGLLPWGWNHKLGFGVVIGVAPDLAEYEKLRQKVLSFYHLT